MNNVIDILSKLNHEEEKNHRKYWRHNISPTNEQFDNSLGKYNENFEVNMGFLDLIENPRLLDALKNLKELELSVIELRYKDDMAFGEIALELQLKDNTASKLHQRSLMKLRQNMRRKDNDRERKTDRHD